LIVTIYESYGIGGKRALIETHDDGSQTKRDIDVRLGITLSTVMRNEDTLMGALKPLFCGWLGDQRFYSDGGGFLLLLYDAVFPAKRRINSLRNAG
jgi:hypothetical protein